MRAADAVTWILLFCGWFAVHLATLARERRKEKREISMQICIALAALQSEAINFHTAPHFSSRKSTDIAQQVERVIAQLQRFPLIELAIPITPMVALRRRITQRNIDPSDFTSQPDDGEIVSAIRSAVADLIFITEGERDKVWK